MTARPSPAGRWLTVTGRVWRDIGRDLSPSPATVGLPRRVLWAALVVGLGFAWFNQLGVPLRATQSARVNVDEPFYLLTTVSLIEDSDLDLANDYELRRYRAFFDHPEELWYQSAPTADGRVLSPHNVGTPLLILPAYAVGGLDGVKRFLALLGGATIGVAVLLAYRATGHLAASVAAATLLGVTAPIFVYSTQIYPEAPSALLVTLCAWLLLGSRPGRPTAVALALALNGLVWLGIKYGLVGGVIALLALGRLRPPAGRLLIALLIPSAAAYAWFHLTTYGGLTPYAVNRIYAGSSTLELVGLHLEVWNRLYRFAGLWIDGEFGLVRWAPILLLTLPAVSLMGRRPGPGRWIFATVFAAQVLVAVFLSVTMRGWWFPGRMMIAVLPLLVMPLAVILVRLRGLPWLAGLTTLLGATSLGITLALRDAVAAEIVVLAVDPFVLPWAPFHLLAGLFPVYTSYKPSTWLLSFAWLAVAGGLVALGRAIEPHREPRSVGEARAAPDRVPDPVRPAIGKSG